VIESGIRLRSLFFRIAAVVGAVDTVDNFTQIRRFHRFYPDLIQSRDRIWQKLVIFRTDVEKVMNSPLFITRLVAVQRYEQLGISYEHPAGFVASGPVVMNRL
jgi:hypothetical protein